MSEPTLEQMSGERKPSPRLQLNEIGLNGNTGEFVFRDVKGGLQEIEGRKRYAQKTLGNEVEVVFLKVRRKLMAHQKDARPLATNEHQSKTDYVRLFGLQTGAESNTAEALREKYQQLKTIQIVYALYEGELVRVFVKGASLGSNNKASENLDFYTYLSSFKKDGREDHMYECKTKLYSVKESGDMGQNYYCMSYKEGEKLGEADMVKVRENMKIAFDFSQEVDAYYGNKSVTFTKPVQDKTDEAGGYEYPDEEGLNPEDIPF